MYITVNGEQVPNQNAYNCHYYTFGPEYASATEAANGWPKWVTSISLPQSDWQLVIGAVQVGDVVIYKGVQGGSQGILHSGKVIGVDPQGNATLISSKMGTYEIIQHHPRDVPSEYGSTSPTYNYNGATYRSREYYRKIQ